VEHQVEQLAAAMRLAQDVYPCLPHSAFAELQSVQQLKIVGQAYWDLDQAI
jgi:hypothetical protein